MLQRSALILAAVLVAGSASASIAAGAKHSEHEESYRRAPMWARSMGPPHRVRCGGNAKRQTLHDRGAALVQPGQWVSVVTGGGLVKESGSAILRLSSSTRPIHRHHRVVIMEAAAISRVSWSLQVRKKGLRENKE